MLHYNCLCTIGPKGLITQEHSQRCFELHLKFCIFTRQLFFKMLQSKLQYYSINILKLSNTDVFNVTHLRAQTVRAQLLGWSFSEEKKTKEIISSLF